MRLLVIVSHADVPSTTRTPVYRTALSQVKHDKMKRDAAP